MNWELNLGGKKKGELKETHFGIKNVDSKLVNGGFCYLS